MVNSTHLCSGIVDFVQQDPPVGGAIASVQVVLDHFGSPLGLVVAWVQLPGQHHVLFKIRLVVVVGVQRGKEILEEGNLNEKGAGVCRLKGMRQNEKVWRKENGVGI
ncbi:hypothetical protein NHX12_009149 [Muraenolepis orangiensis]|uniref:Uncharacterized protein n=1 Tax=Muraenolepis orangiensis TaxID=630683 RepID=A0A9Q0DMX2_9TELE|nr:hypothetical protein NHX12_009149 [Muraenolepis orangiensis]